MKRTRGDHPETCIRLVARCHFLILIYHRNLLLITTTPGIPLKISLTEFLAIRRFAVLIRQLHRTPREQQQTFPRGWQSGCGASRAPLSTILIVPIRRSTLQQLIGDNTVLVADFHL